MTPPAWVFSDAPYTGGAEQYLTDLLHSAGPARLGLIAVTNQGLRGWIDARQAEGFAVERLAPGPLPARWRGLHQLLRRLRPRLVHLNLPGPYDAMLSGAVPVAKLAGVPRVVVSEHLPGVGRVGKRFWLKRSTVLAADVVVAECRAHEDLLARNFGYPKRRIVHIPIGIADSNPSGHIAAARPRPWPKELAARERVSGPRIVQVGALDRRKGGDVFIEAARLLVEQGVPATFWMVGDGPARTEFEHRIAEGGLGERVLLAGHRHDLPALLSGTDIAVLASRQEGMPLSLVAALAHGLPVVATAVDGNLDLVIEGWNGRLVPPEDPRMLAWALRDLSGDAPLRARWGARSREHYLKHHTLPRMAAATFAAYGAWFDHAA